MSRFAKALLLSALVVLLSGNGILGVVARAKEPLLPLKISESGRHLTTSDGKPFFWLADTGWLLFHRLAPDEAERYLKDRAEKGFTVIQTMIVGTDDEFSVSGDFGGLAFEEGDPGRPNEKFFQHVDWVVAKANALGLRFAIAPTWANQIQKTGPRKGTPVFDVSSARAYGEFMANRYQEAGVIWIVGGDCLVKKGDAAIWRALADGLRAGGNRRHLITGHFRGGSSHLFHKEPWLDFNFAYSGHAWAAPNYKDILRDRALKPTKPVIDGEPRYENHPYIGAEKRFYRNKKAWDGKRRGDAHQMREAAYWAMLAGAAGHSYGAHDIWQMYDPAKREPKTHANTPWYKALDFPGARQMGIMRRFFESFAWQTLEPDASVIVGGQGPGEHHAQAARARDGSLLIVYLPIGDRVSIRMNAISCTGDQKVDARWFDPRSGNWISIGRFRNHGEHHFVPPSQGEQDDWVLVLQMYESEQQPAKIGRPNIIFILSDDQGWADIGYQSKDIMTPHLDQLAMSGVRLTHHYVQPTCSPTRAALLFGKYPSRLGVLTPIRSRNHLPRTMITLPKLLREVGYRTHISGKWHLGPTLDYGPNHYGFDTSYGYLHGQVDPYTHRYKFGDTTWHRNGRFVKEKGHATDLITDEAVRVVESSGEKPFFLYVAYNVPHYPLDEPRRWLDLYDGKIDDPSRKLFAASVSHMDDGIGRIMAAVEKAGKSKQTLVLFSSDNGGQRSWDAPKNQYDGRYAPNPVLGNNLPLRGWKTQLYEGGIRVPAFACWPGVLEPRELGSPMHIADWMPTLARLTGCAEQLPNDLDGHDVLDALWGKPNVSPRPPIYWKIPGAAAVRADGWKLIVTTSGKKELYDLTKDPYEQHELSKKHPDRLAKLTALLQELAAADRKWAPAE